MLKSILYFSIGIITASFFDVSVLTEIRELTIALGVELIEVSKLIANSIYNGIEGLINGQ